MVKILEKIPENFDTDFVKIVQIELIIRTTLEALEENEVIFKDKRHFMDLISIITINKIQSKPIWATITNEFIRLLMAEQFTMLEIAESLSYFRQIALHSATLNNIIYSYLDFKQVTAKYLIELEATQN